MRVYMLGAMAAVLGFLILSGYSIGHSISRNPQGYYRRRIVRIYPLYALAILFTLCVAWAGHMENPEKLVKVGIGNLLFLQTYKFVPMLYDPVLWTLAIEATCYALAPLFARLNTPTLMGLAGLSAIAYSYYPFMNLSYYAWLPWGKPLMFLLWPWLVGFIYQRERSRPLSALWLIVVPLAICNVNRAYEDRFSNLTMLSILIAIAVGGSLGVPAMIKKAWSFLGDYSYPLYLFHAPAFYLSGALNIHKTWGYIAVAFGIALIAWGLDLALRPAINRRSIVISEKLQAAMSGGRLAFARAAEHLDGTFARTLLHLVGDRAKILLRVRQQDGLT